jgi:preprotein translocase subunit SecD
MTTIEDQLQELLREAAPQSIGVDYAEVSRRGRRLQRRRRVAATASAVVVSAVVVSLSAVLALSGHSDKATVSPLPATASSVSTTLTPASHSATAADLRADAAILTRRLAAAGIDGRVQVGTGSITLHLPASAADSVASLASAGQLSFRIPGAIERAPTTSTTAAGGCVASAGLLVGKSPPPCITARLSASCPKPGSAESQRVARAPAADWIVACDTNGTEYALAPQRLGGDSVASATATLLSGADGVSTGQWTVSVSFTPSGRSAWSDLTAAISSAAGCPASGAPACSLAIVVDGVVQSAPIIQSRIAGDAEISGGSFTEQSAKALAAALSSGALPVPLTVGPS